jgi:hypothetical protein
VQRLQLCTATVTAVVVAAAVAVAAVVAAAVAVAVAVVTVGSGFSGVPAVFPINDCRVISAECSTAAAVYAFKVSP